MSINCGIQLHVFFFSLPTPKLTWIHRSTGTQALLCSNPRTCPRCSSLTVFLVLFPRGSCLFNSGTWERERPLEGIHLSPQTRTCLHPPVSEVSSCLMGKGMEILHSLTCIDSALPRHCPAPHRGLCRTPWAGGLRAEEGSPWPWALTALGAQSLPALLHWQPPSCLAQRAPALWPCPQEPPGSRWCPREALALPQGCGCTHTSTGTSATSPQGFHKGQDTRGQCGSEKRPELTRARPALFPCQPCREAAALTPRQQRGSQGCEGQRWGYQGSPQ